MGPAHYFGGCQLQRHEDGPWTVSYWTGAAHRGQGVATRALKLLLSHFDREGITGLECHVAEDNAASRRVAEAAGFTDPLVAVEPDGQVMVRYRMRRDVHRWPVDRKPRPAS
jgi:RimJ/RimL family protein N-acetyltransferase